MRRLLLKEKGIKVQRMTLRESIHCVDVEGLQERKDVCNEECTMFEAPTICSTWTQIAIFFFVSWKQ